MQLHAGKSISCPLPHARTGKEARSLGSETGKERSKKRARGKRSVTQRKTEEYSLKKQENKILSEEQPIFFSKLRADTLVFKKN